MRLARLLPSLLATALLLAATSAGAQAPPPYGTPISLEQAKRKRIEYAFLKCSFQRACTVDRVVPLLHEQVPR